MKRVFFASLLSLFAGSYLYAAQSTITDVEGNACMGDDKSRKQTEEYALADAKRKAVEFTSTYIKSETEVKDFVLATDLLSAYAHAEVKVLQELSKEWYRDINSGDCLKLKIKAEVLPDKESMARLADQRQSIGENPAAPLHVKMWTDKKEYRNGEGIKVYIKGNKPFHARVLYKDVSGEIVQILPNPYRSESYFNGGTIYEIPGGGDRFELEVSPPFGEEKVIVYASNASLGEINKTAQGGVFLIKSSLEDVGMKTRGINIVQKKEGGALKGAEFFEDTVKVRTRN